MLRDALSSNDSLGIAQAATLLQADSARVVQAQGTVGAREKDIASRKTDANNELLQMQSSLSTLQDTDMTTAISLFQQLQTSYQGALKMAGATQNLSLINFLT
jgi:flagellin-like hook-associated protein FlgL